MAVVKKGVLLCLVLLFSLSFVGAQETSEVRLSFADQSGTLLADHLAIITIDDQQREQRYLGDDAEAILALPPGPHRVVVSLRSLEQDSAFYLAQQSFRVDQDLTLKLTAVPVAHLSGMVQDRYDNLVIHAKLTFQCEEPLAGTFPVQTDEVGSFRVPNLPMGRCRVIASAKDAAGVADIEIISNTLYDVKVALDHKRTGQGVSFVLFIIAGLALLIIGAVVVWQYRSNRRVCAPASQQTVSITPRMRDILLTLDETQREVVDYLLNQNGCATQTRIRQFTGIPKTSLFRCIGALERKRIVTTSSIGKMKTVTLTPFFLQGKDGQNGQIV
ncbi:MAG: hypothetical protein ABIC95_01390 [archaeon]